MTFKWPFPNNHKPTAPKEKLEEKPKEKENMDVYKPRYVSQMFQLDTYYIEITTNNYVRSAYGSSVYETHRIKGLTKEEMENIVLDMNRCERDFLDFKGFMIHKNDIKNAKYGREYETRSVPVYD